MRVEIGMQRGLKNKDPKLAVIRRANTEANTKYGTCGMIKRRGNQKPVTLPVLKFTDPK